MIRAPDRRRASELLLGGRHAALGASALARSRTVSQASMRQLGEVRCSPQGGRVSGRVSHPDLELLPGRRGGEARGQGRGQRRE